MRCLKVYDGPIPGRVLGEGGVLFLFLFSKFVLTNLAANVMQFFEYFLNYFPQVSIVNDLI